MERPFRQRGVVSPHGAGAGPSAYSDVHALVSQTSRPHRDGDARRGPGLLDHLDPAVAGWW